MHSYGRFSISNLPHVHTFGQREEAEEHPLTQGENAAHRKGPGLGSNLLPSCCEATVITGAPLCRHSHFNSFAHLSENICLGKTLPAFNLPDSNLAL